jgi:hypothetical protein
MANDFNLNEFKLKDPVNNIQDGLQEPVKDSTPGFFQSIKNPIDLWREESLPASIYQWISGNTKKKQAQEALDYIRSNPEQEGSKIYKEAERHLNRFGYLLEDGPMNIDMKEIKNVITANPKLFGAEMINMMMADPYLLFMPMGWGRLGRGVVNGLRLKFGKQMSLAKIPRRKASIMSDLKVGAFATLATPFVFSGAWQLGEDATLDPKRLAVETTLGATAGAVFSVGFAGMGAMAQRLTKFPKNRVAEIQGEVLKKYNINPEKLLEPNEQGIPRSINEFLNEIKKEVDDTFVKEPIPRKLNIIYEDIKSPQAMAFFRRSKDGGTVFMDTKRIEEAYVQKAWTKPRIDGVDPLPENQFKSPKEFQDFIYYHELSHWQNSRLPNEPLGVYESRMNTLALDTANKAKLDAKVTQDILNSEYKFDVIKADMTAALREIMENGRDMSISTLFKGAASVGAVFGTAQFLTAEDDKLLATAKGIGLGAAIYGAGTLLNRHLKRIPKDFAEVELIAEATMDAAKISTVKLNSAGTALGNRIKEMLPDAIDSRRRVFYYLTKGSVNRKTFQYDPRLGPILETELNAAEREAAKAIKTVFDSFGETFGSSNKGSANLFQNLRSNYLPLLWNHYDPKIQAFRFVKQFDKDTLNSVSGISNKFQFGRRILDDIDQGLKKGFTIKAGYDDPAELIKIYVHAAGKALSTRAMISSLQRSKVAGSPLLIRKGINIPEGNYMEFRHPYFEDKLGYPHIHKGMERSIRMVFDARDEPALMSAIFTTNLMMKRLAVGFSFFHAGALVESLWFAGAKPKFIKKILDPRSKAELEKLISNPETYAKEFPHAVNVLNDMGFKDVIQFSRGMGLQISAPEDIGFDRFYYNLRGIDKTLKNHFGISTNGNIEKVFKWFDQITWDRVFTQAKLHTFLTVLNRNNLKGVPNKIRIEPGDTQSVIYRKAAQAATFTNDAFGGQNWEQLANRIQTPWLKSLLQTTFAPGSRGYMQLLMFAPDWTISNLRIIAKSLPAFESDPGLRRMYQYYFARAALTYAAAGSALNYIFSGHSLLENVDPTRIDLGDGEVLTFSKQLMEPFHWITDPTGTGLKKIGALPRVVTEVLTDKKYLTTKWSPNITKQDDEAIKKGLAIGGHVGKRFLPIWLQQAAASVEQGLQKDGLSLDLAVDTSVDFVLGQLGHPRYKGPRYTQYNTKGLVRSPYETLF